jgi:hypothetical protein
MKAIAVILLAAGGSACAAPSAYVYRPTELANATAEDGMTVRYHVPRADPRGDVYVVARGITKPGEVASASPPMLHVQMTVSNRSGDQPWIVDTRDQLLALPREGQARPTHVKTAAAGAPLIGVMPGGLAKLDIYYALPGPLQSGQNIKSFDFLWQVSADGKTLAQSVAFTRFHADNASPPPSAKIASTQ